MCWTVVMAVFLTDTIQLSPPALFRILQVLRAYASGAGEHGVHQTAHSQLLAQHLPEALSRRRQDTERYACASGAGKVGDCPPRAGPCLPPTACVFLPAADVLDEDKFNVELIVQCIRVSEMPQTHHHALLLLGTVAGIFPVSGASAGIPGVSVVPARAGGCTPVSCGFCISLMTKEVEHLFMCYGCSFAFGEMSFSILCTF